jgi:hypothetical protein
LRTEGELEHGQQLGLQLDEGMEVFCARGRLRIVAAAPWITGHPQGRLLATGQGWRAGHATRITLQAERPSRYIIGQR